MNRKLYFLPIPDKKKYTVIKKNKLATIMFKLNINRYTYKQMTIYIRAS